MSSVGTVDLDLTTNTAPFQRQLNGIAGQATGLVGGAFMKLGGAIAAAFAVGGMIQFGRGAIALASNLQEVQNVVDVTFTSMANQVNSFAQNAITQFGLSELSAKKFASTMGAMLKSSGMSGQTMTNMSLGLTGLAADMASFYNLKPEEAFYKLQAGISGEIEPLRQLGINMTIANLEAYALSQGIKTSYQNMSQASQALLRYNYLMKATKDAQGDFARTTHSWANQTRLLSEQWNVMKTTMGQGFINMLTPLLAGINKIIARLQVAAMYFKAFTEMVFGNSAVVGSSAGVNLAGAAATDALGASADKTAEKVKKASAAIKGSLGSFDQLNVLGQKANDTAADAGLGDVGDIGGLGAGGEVKGPEIDTGKLQAVKEVLDSIARSARQVGQFMRDAFNSAPVQAFVDYVKTVFSTLYEGVIKPIMKGISKVVKDALEDIKSFWDKHGASLLAGVTTTFGIIKALFNTLWKTTLEPIVRGMTEGLTWLWDKHLRGVVTSVLELVAKLVKAAMEIFNGFIAPIATNLLKIFGPSFASAFTLVSGIVMTLIATLADVAKGVFKILGGITDFIAGVFTGNWRKAWQGVKDIFSGIFMSLGAVVKGAMNLIIDAVNWMIRGLNRIHFDIPDWVPSALGGGKSFGINLMQIPKLANGGLVSQPTLAMVGDNKNARVDPEVISPLSKLQEMIASSIAQALGSGGGQGDGDVILMVGETELGRVAIKAINAVQRQTGVTLLVT